MRNRREAYALRSPGRSAGVQVCGQAAGRARLPDARTQWNLQPRPRPRRAPPGQLPHHPRHARAPRRGRLESPRQYRPLRQHHRRHNPARPGRRRRAEAPPQRRPRPPRRRRRRLHRRLRPNALGLLNI